MNKEKKKIDLVYIFLHKKLREKAGGNFINKKDAAMFLAHSYRIPKNLGYAVLRELEIMGLIKFVGKENDNLNIEILESQEEIEDVSKIYRDLGIL